MDAKAHEEEEARKKTWLLNEETRRFLKGPYDVVACRWILLRIWSWRGLHHQSGYHHWNSLSSNSGSARHSHNGSHARLHRSNHLYSNSDSLRNLNRYAGSYFNRPPLPIRQQLTSLPATTKYPIHHLPSHLPPHLSTPALLRPSHIGRRRSPKPRREILDRLNSNRIWLRRALQSHTPHYQRDLGR